MLCRGLLIKTGVPTSRLPAVTPASTAEPGQVDLAKRVRAGRMEKQGGMEKSAPEALAAKPKENAGADMRVPDHTPCLPGAALFRHWLAGKRAPFLLIAINRA